MIVRWELWSSLLLAFALVVPRAASAQRITNTWVEERSLWETRLAEAEVVSVEDVGSGVTNPQRAELRSEDVRFAAVFKPIRRGRHHGFLESYEAEVAAYRLDRMLGLDMVPPTIVRRLGAHLGSLQLWVEDCATYERVADQVPRTPRLSHQISRMKMFDNLIGNADRNAGNFLLDRAWNVILIDHSRAFVERRDLFGGSKKPAQYDSSLVERLKTLEREGLDAALGALLRGEQIEAILRRRDRLLEHVRELVAERGEKAVFFAPQER